MGLTAVDPELLIYEAHDWHNKDKRQYSRVEMLLLHRRFAREFNQPLAMSSRLCGAIMQRFPWHLDAGTVAELRDLRQVILGDLSRLDMIDSGDECEAEVPAGDVAAPGPSDPEVAAAWEQLLAGCTLESQKSGSVPRIATWDSVPGETPRPVRRLMILCDPGEPNTYSLRVVWDEDSWYSDLAEIDWWPDLQRSVDLLYATSPALRASATREPPLAFSVTSAFARTLERFCQEPGLRRSLVEAIAKLVHGVTDKGLGDERFKNLRRFRVSRSWRVHYRVEKSCVVLLEFGPHDIGRSGRKHRVGPPG